MGNIAYTATATMGAWADYVAGDTPTILALDLASKRLGFAYLAGDRLLAAGSVGFAGAIMLDRLTALGQWLTDALLPGTSCLAIESPDLMAQGMTTNPGTLRALFAALGVALECARRAEVAVRVIDPRLVKERIARRKTAGKDEVQLALHRMGYELPRIDGKAGGAIDDDAADAIALGVVMADHFAFVERHRLTEMARGKEIGFDG